MHVDNIWTQFAESYDQVIPRLHCYQRMLKKILRDTANARTVIDAGCGTGIVSEALVQRGQTVYGFDNNQGMLGLAEQRHRAASAAQRNRWTLTSGDVEEFPAAAPLNVDAIVLNNVLFYVRDANAVLAHCEHHLAPGGIVVLTGPKQRPNMERVLNESIEEWRGEGLFDGALQQALAHHVSLARKLTSNADEMRTFFSVEALVDKLRHQGLARVIAADGDDYFGENYYVACRKEGGQA